MNNSTNNLNLGDRRDFWNTGCNPITGWPVPKNLLSDTVIEKEELKAEYNYN